MACSTRPPVRGSSCVSSAATLAWYSGKNVGSALMPALAGRYAEGEHVLIAEEIVALPQLEPGRAGVGHDLLRIDALFHGGAGAVAVLLEVDDRDHTSRLQRRHDVLQELHRMLDLVVRVDDEDDVHLAGRQFRIVGCPALRPDVAASFARHPAFDRLDHLRLN